MSLKVCHILASSKTLYIEIVMQQIWTKITRIRFTTRITNLVKNAAFVNSDRYTDVDMIMDGQIEPYKDSINIQALYEHNIGNLLKSDPIPGASTTNENNLDVCDEKGEVDTINAVIDDKNSLTSTFGLFDIDCSLYDEGDNASIVGGDITVASLFGSGDHAIPKIILEEDDVDVLDPISQKI